MAKFLAPLANITEDSSDSTDFNISNDKLDANFNVKREEVNCNHVEEPLQTIESELDFDDAFFPDSMTGSLEDLVNTFDAKITNCFRNYNEQTDTLAPVQLRSQDEILSESP